MPIQREQNVLRRRRFSVRDRHEVFPSPCDYSAEEIGMKLQRSQVISCKARGIEGITHVSNVAAPADTPRPGGALPALALRRRSIRFILETSSTWTWQRPPERVSGNTARRFHRGTKTTLSCSGVRPARESGALTRTQNARHAP